MPEITIKSVQNHSLNSRCHHGCEVLSKINLNTELAEGATLGLIKSFVEKSWDQCAKEFVNKDCNMHATFSVEQIDRCKQYVEDNVAYNLTIYVEQFKGPSFKEQISQANDAFKQEQRRQREHFSSFFGGERGVAEWESDTYPNLDFN